MTLPIKFANYSFSTLAVGCDSAATSLSVPAGHGARFPALAAGEYFYATLENAALNREIVKVTARVDDTLTVLRAQDNTTARSWNAGDSLSLRVNAAAFADVSKAENHEYTPAGTGAVATTVQAKLRETVSVGDFPGTESQKLQLLLNAGGRVELIRGTTYTVNTPLTVTVAGTQLVGNGAKIVYTREQSGTPSYAESLFNVSADDVVIENVVLQYTGTFTVGGNDYGGYVSGIHVEDADRFIARKVEAYGFNRAGINVAMGAAYCKEPKILDCYLHNNRVSGVIFGNTDNGIVQTCTLSYNGLSTSIGTGYGFGGWSACVPKNTILANNQANDNYRKGLDYHAGENGTIIGNVCARNRIYGIYVMGVKGSWTITGNTVTDMTWGNEFPTVSPYGIRVGDLAGQGLSEIPTSFVIDSNVISKMNKTAGSMFAIGESMVGCSYGKLTISNNIVDVGTVSQLYAGDSSVTGTAGNYFDVSITGNQFTAQTCDASGPPIYIRSSKNRKKIFSNNHISITSVSAATSGVFLYDSTVIGNNCLIAIGNSIDAPTSAWSAAYDPIAVRRTAQEKMYGTIVNGTTWRDWDSRRFILSGSGGAAPSTNYWTQGSVFWNVSASAGGTPGWVCTTAGTPGTWKAMANLAA